MSRTHRNAIIPSPIVQGMSLTEWFMGCALMNPDVTKDLDPESVATTAVAYAVGSVTALKAPRVPQHVDPPSEEEMERWVQIMNNMSRETSHPRKIERGEAMTPSSTQVTATSRPAKRSGG